MQFSNLKFIKSSSPLVDYVKNSVINGTYARVVEMVVKDGFVRDHFVKSDDVEKQNVKIIAAIAIANCGRKIADEMKNCNKVDEVKKIPSDILIDVMKMAIQAGAAPQNIAAFIDILKTSGKLEEITNF